MRSMTPCEFGDVVLVPFPFTDQSQAKRRPAVVISSTALSDAAPDLIILAITSQTAHKRRLDRTVADWKEAGLLRPSLFKPVVTTIDPSLIIRKLGTLSSADRETLSEMLSLMFLADRR